MTNKEIDQAIKDSLEETNGDVILAIEDMLDSCIRDLFNMNNWDESDSHEKIIEYDGKKYQITIEEDGCCEATHEHRIMYWKHTVVEFI